MNENQGDVVEAPAVPVAEEGKKKRGRPKKADGIKLPRKAKRDIYHEAFGDKRAAVAVAALKRGPEGKAIIAAVKTFASSASKRAKLIAKRDKLMAKNEALVKKVEEVDAKLAKFVDAGEAVKNYQGRVLSMIESIYGKDVQVKSLI
jgi:seryl-tRNA synthetase